MRDSHANKGHKAVLVLLALFCAYALVPVAGVGMYRNGSGQIFFETWYLLGFLIVSFFLMHELITPLPPKEDTSGAAKSGRAGGGGQRVLTPVESTGR